MSFGIAQLSYLFFMPYFNEFACAVIDLVRLREYPILARIAYLDIFQKVVQEHHALLGTHLEMLIPVLIGIFAEFEDNDGFWYAETVLSEILSNFEEPEVYAYCLAIVGDALTSEDWHSRFAGLCGLKMVIPYLDKKQRRSIVGFVTAGVHDLVAACRAVGFQAIAKLADSLTRFWNRHGHQSMFPLLIETLVQEVDERAIRKGLKAMARIAKVTEPEILEQYCQTLFEISAHFAHSHSAEVRVSVLFIAREIAGSCARQFQQADLASFIAASLTSENSQIRYAAISSLPAVCAALLGDTANRMAAIGLEAVAAYPFDDFTVRQKLAVILSLKQLVYTAFPFDALLPELLRLCAQKLEFRFEPEDFDRTIEPVFVQKLPLRGRVIVFSGEQIHQITSALRVLNSFIKDLPVQLAPISRDIFIIITVQLSEPIEAVRKTAANCLLSAVSKVEELGLSPEIFLKPLGENPVYPSIAARFAKSLKEMPAEFTDSVIPIAFKLVNESRQRALELLEDTEHDQLMSFISREYKVHICVAQLFSELIVNRQVTDDVMKELVSIYALDSVNVDHSAIMEVWTALHIACVLHSDDFFEFCMNHIFAEQQNVREQAIKSLVILTRMNFNPKISVFLEALLQLLRDNGDGCWLAMIAVGELLER
jgi:hypothetical protein